MADHKRAARDSSYRGSYHGGTQPSSSSSNNPGTSDHLRRVSRSPVAIDHLTESIGEDNYTSNLLHQVFFAGTRPSSPLEGATSLSPTRKSFSLSSVESHISSCLKEVTENEIKSNKNNKSSDVGRLGPPECIFDIVTNVGTLIVDPDRLGITSHSNFSSIKANCCVYEGKWVYELMLASKGVMQLGWCTANCKFSQEEGVGDTRDSYAYDGSRLRKWNVTTKKYGEPWMSGDVISCAIDCGDGVISFYRNGVFMGEAFTKVRVGPGYAYFPAVSLSFAETVQANFGALPLRYPIEGFKPLQNPRGVEVAEAELLFTYLHNLLPKIIENDQLERHHNSNTKGDYPLPALTDRRSHKSTLCLVAAHIFHKLAPLLVIPYVIELCLVKFMLGLCDPYHWQSDQVYINKLLDLFWMLMQEQEIQECMEHLMISLLSGYRFLAFHPEFKYPKKYLALTFAVLKHPRTRRHLLTFVLYP